MNLGTFNNLYKLYFEGGNSCLVYALLMIRKFFPLISLLCFPRISFNAPAIQNINWRLNVIRYAGLALCDHMCWAVVVYQKIGSVDQVLKQFFKSLFSIIKQFAKLFSRKTNPLCGNFKSISIFFYQRTQMVKVVKSLPFLLTQQFFVFSKVGNAFFVISKPEKELTYIGRFYCGILIFSCFYDGA